MSAALARARRAENRWQPSLADRLRQSREDRKTKGRKKEPTLPVKQEPVQQRYLLQPGLQVDTGIFTQNTGSAFITGMQQEFDTFGQTRIRFTVSSNTTDATTITHAVNRYAGLPLNSQTVQIMKAETKATWQLWHDTATTCNNCITVQNTEWQGWITTPVRTYNEEWGVWYDRSANGTGNLITGPRQRVQVGESLEQRRRREQQEERWRQEEAARQKQWAAEEAQRKAADETAMKLLVSCLNAEQQKDLKKNGYFFVKARSGRVYRIDKGISGNIKTVHPTTKAVQESLCIYPSGLPVGDVMLAQKLFLECHEEAFRRHANITMYGEGPDRGKYIQGAGGLLTNDKLAEIIPIRRAA